MIYKVSYRITPSEGSVFVEASSRDAAEKVALADMTKLCEGCVITDMDVDVDAIHEIPNIMSLDDIVRTHRAAGAENLR